MADTLSGWSAHLANTYGTPPLEIVSGHGATLVDAAGKEYLDCLAGIAVNSLGYAHPAIIAAVDHQIRQIAHASNLLATRPVVAAAKGILAHLGSAADQGRVFFCNSGAEANEAAFKLARKTGRRRILAAEHGFHGRTMGSLAMTGQPSKRRAFEPLPSGVEFYPYGDIDYLRKQVAIDPSDTAAIILEPIQGETGVIPAPEGFLREVRELCDAHGILMIADEVQTGVGRTGDFFACQHEDVLPDIITMAKGLGGGLPIGACVTCTEQANLFQPGDHGTTFGGNPVACAAAGAVLGVIDADFLAAVRAKGEQLTAGVAKLAQVAQVRGRGLMLGVVLREPVAKQAVAAALRHGLIINAPAADIIRLVPPLVISEEEISEVTRRLGAVLAEVEGH